MKPLFIISSSAISPQNSFEESLFLNEIFTADNLKLVAREAPFSQYINPVSIRRMSRMLKMAISAAMDCFRKAAINHLDAIITGTSHGSMHDMQLFLKEIKDFEEGTLNPTYFIQSTYNAPNGWIAMQTQSKCYNQTFVHRGLSFEWTLFDAIILTSEAIEKQHYLIGSYDEFTDDYFYIRTKIDYWKKEPIHSLDLFKNNHSKGTIIGEGVSFFVLSNEPQSAHSGIHFIKLIERISAEKIKTEFRDFLIESGLEIEEIDLIICGKNGDYQEDTYYQFLENDYSEIPQIGFKHIVGEYETSTGFALWLANYLIQFRIVAPVLSINQKYPQRLKNIIIINHFKDENASIIFVKATKL